MTVRRRQLPSAVSTFVIAAVAVATAGCGGKKTEDRPPPDPESASASDSASEPGAASAGSLSMMGSLLSSQMDAPGPYDPPRSSPDFDDDEPHAAVLEIGGPLVEVRSIDWFGGVGGTELRLLVDRLAELAAAERVGTIVLRFDSFAPSAAHAEELRRDLVALRAADSALMIACHADSAGQFAYHVMTACTEIGLTVGGSLAIPGVAAVPIHVKGMLDKMGVSADFINIGAYKGAADPLTRDRPSAESRETTAAILDRAYATVVAGIADGRRVSKDEARALIDIGLFSAEDAAAAGLIDRVADFRSFRDRITDGLPWTAVKVGEEESSTTRLLQLIGMAPRARPSGDRVALIYAVGNVIDGDGQGIGGARSEIAASTAVAAIRALAEDDEIKAVVLRINSPGGSALASETIWGALAEIKASTKKPFVVSMGPVAASGGYYIAAAADRIFALDNTLTGSIGVIGGKLAINGGLSKLGVSAFPEGRGKHALLFNTTRKWTAAERAVVRAAMLDTYARFADRVRKGRGEIDDTIMQGRVWTGADARDRKLVDEIGGLRSALAFARERAGLSADAPIETYPPEPTIKDLLGAFGVSSGLAAQLTAAVAETRRLPPALRAGLTATLRLTATFETAAIQTVLPAAIVVQ